MISDLILRLLAEASLRGAIVLAVAGIVAVCARRGSAELRHAIWSAAVVAALAMPLGLFLMPRWSLPILPVEKAAPAVARTAPAQPGTLAINGWIEPVAMPESKLPLGALLVGLWLAGGLAIVIPERRARRRLAALRRATKPALDPGLVRAFRDAAGATGVTFPVECRLSEELRVPIACGIERPAVLLPAAAVGWSPEVLRDVLVHELSHLRRRDASWLWVAAAARAVYWFHPLVWLATRRMRAESERACDDAVMRGGERPSRYAETLLFVASAQNGREPRAALAFVRPHGLERRIGELLARGRNWSALSRKGRFLVVSLAVVLGVGVAVARPVAAVSSATPSPAPTPRAQDERGWRPIAPGRTFAAEACNEEQGPVRVQDAAVELTKGTNGETRVAWPRLKLVNFDRSRGVTAVRLAFELPTTRDQTWKEVEIGPRRSAEVTLDPNQWSAIVPSEDAERLIVQVSGVRFANGATWGGKDTIELPAAKRAKGSRNETPAPEARRSAAKSIRISTSFPDEPSVAARFRNPADAPVVIVGARTPTGIPRRGMTRLPAVMLENRTDREVVSLRLRYKADDESHAVSGYEVTIEPGATLVLQRTDFEVWGRPPDMTVQVLGARFADGTIWGTMDSRIDGRDRWVYPLEEDGAR